MSKPGAMHYELLEDLGSVLSEEGVKLIGDALGRVDTKDNPFAAVVIKHLRERIADEGRGAVEDLAGQLVKALKGQDPLAAVYVLWNDDDDPRRADALTEMAEALQDLGVRQRNRQVTATIQLVSFLQDLGSAFGKAVVRGFK